MNLEFYDKLKQMAQQVTEREGCYLYDIEMVGKGSGRILRVYIDRKTQKTLDDVEKRILESKGVGLEEDNSGTGPSIEDCANVSRGLSLLLDVEDIIPGGAYELEVSSPGLERRLKEVWHYQQALNKKVEVKANKDLTPVGLEKPKVKSFKSTLVNADDEKAYFEDENFNWEVNYSDIHKAKVIFEYKPAGKKKLNKKKNKKH